MRDIENYNDKGQWHDYQEFYHSNGKLMYKGFFYNDIRVDYEEFYYYSNGRLKKSFYI